MTRLVNRTILVLCMLTTQTHAMQLVRRTFSYQAFSPFSRPALTTLKRSFTTNVKKLKKRTDGSSLSSLVGGNNAEEHTTKVSRNKRPNHGGYQSLTKIVAALAMVGGIGFCVSRNTD